MIPFELHMTEEEILLAYREAANKQEQVYILADCNLCPPRDMAEWLRDHGQPLTAFWRSRIAATRGMGNPQARRPSSFWRATGDKMPAKFRPVIVSWGANAEAVLGCAVWDGEIWHRDGFKCDPPDFWMPFPKAPHVEKGATG